MNEEEIHIDRFLAGDLEPSQVEAFARRLEQDEQLRQRVNLRRELTDYFVSGEAALVDLLETVGEEVAPPAPSSPKRRWWWALLGILPVGFLLWQLGSEENLPPVTSPVPSEVPLQQAPVTEPAATIEADTQNPAPLSTPAPASAPPQSPSKAPPALPEVPDTVTAAPPVYASLNPADFAPNPYLEDIVTGAVRTTNSPVTIALAEDTLLLINAPYLLLSAAEAPPSVEAFLYDNSPNNFLEERPIYQQQVTNWKQTDEAVTARLGLTAIPKPGRYYVLLLNSDGDVLNSRRLLIR